MKITFYLKGLLNRAFQRVGGNHLVYMRIEILKDADELWVSSKVETYSKVWNSADEKYEIKKRHQNADKIRRLFQSEMANAGTRYGYLKMNISK